MLKVCPPKSKISCLRIFFLAGVMHQKPEVRSCTAAGALPSLQIKPICGRSSVLCRVIITQKKNIASLEQRLLKAQERLAAAEKDYSEHIDAFRAGAEKLEQKLAAAKEELTPL